MSSHFHLLKALRKRQSSRSLRGQPGSKRRILFPNLITALGLLSGLFVIFKVNMVHPGERAYGVVMASFLLLCISGLADFTDGWVARKMRAQSRFGLVFDSLSDAITFGIAPALLALKTLSVRQGSLISFLATSAAMVYVLCGVLRLARFSVMKEIVKSSHEDSTVSQRYFVGLPVPAACSALVSLNLFVMSPWTLKKWVARGFDARLIGEEYDFMLNDSLANTSADLGPLIILIVAMYFLGFLMVSRWKFPTLGRLNPLLRKNRIGIEGDFFSFSRILSASLLTVICFYGLSLSLPLGLTLMTWSYVLLGWLISLFHFFRGNYSRAKGIKFNENEPES